METFWKRRRNAGNVMNAVVLIPGQSVFYVMQQYTHARRHCRLTEYLARVEICLCWSWGDGVVNNIHC